MYILVVYVPESYIEQVKEALFSAKAGKCGNYDRCCWQILGQGQFRPLEGSHPFSGKKGRQESINEYRLEMIVEDPYIPHVLQSLLKNHPYEKPAYHLLPVKTLIDFKTELLTDHSKMGLP